LPFIGADQPDILCLQETKAKPEQVVLDILAIIIIEFRQRKPVIAERLLSARPCQIASLTISPAIAKNIS